MAQSLDCRHGSYRCKASHPAWTGKHQAIGMRTGQRGADIDCYNAVYSDAASIIEVLAGHALPTASFICS